MEPERAKRIWERSIRKNKLRYTKFCVQKGVGCRLRKLKENVKGLSGKEKLTHALID